jgi:hypothetical protein
MQIMKSHFIMNFVVLNFLKVFYIVIGDDRFI